MGATKVLGGWGDVAHGPVALAPPHATLAAPNPSKAQTRALTVFAEDHPMIDVSKVRSEVDRNLRRGIASEIRHWWGEGSPLP